MNVYGTEQIRNVVLLGHGGAGKTTVAEALALVTGVTTVSYTHLDVYKRQIPESAQGDHSNVATIGFAVGFVVMMILDVALG